MAALAITSCGSKATTDAGSDNFDYTVDRLSLIHI